MNDTQAGQWAPDFTLPAETVQALLAFADRHRIEDADGFVDMIQQACRRFLVHRVNEAQRLPAGEVHKRLWEVREHALAMLESAEAIRLLLDQPDVLARVKLDIMMGMGQDRLWWQRGGRDFLRDLCGNLSVLAGVGVGCEPGAAGRPRGSGRNGHGHLLAIALCDCLVQHSVRVRQDDKAGEARQLLDILRGPLGIGKGEFNGILKTVVKDHKYITG